MELLTKWFSEATPTNATKASTTIGSGDNGVITITGDNVGTEGNDYTIAVAIASGANADMTATLSGKDISVTLGTGVSAGVVDDTKNTATLIATAIAALAGVTATSSGTGATALTEAVTKKNLTGGLYGTICPIGDVWVKISTTYYYCAAPNDKYGANWKTVAFTAY